MSNLDNNPRKRVSNPYVKPRDEVEISLASIWADVLQIESQHIGATDSFFELGGNSLQLSTVANQVQAQFNVSLSLAMIFDALTVANMAAQIQLLLKQASPKNNQTANKKTTLIEI